MNIKVMMLLKFPPKFLGFAGLRENAHQFLPIYTTFGEEALFEIQTAEQRRRRCSWVILAAQFRDLVIMGSLCLFLSCLFFLQNYFESFLTILDYFVSF